MKLVFLKCKKINDAYVSKCERFSINKAGDTHYLVDRTNRQMKVVGQGTLAQCKAIAKNIHQRERDLLRPTKWLNLSQFQQHCTAS